MTVFLELLQAAQTKNFQPQIEGQSDEDFLKELAVCVATIDQAVWDKLSKPAQTWYTLMRECLNYKRSFNDWPTLPGYREYKVMAMKRAQSQRQGVVKRIREIVMMDPLLSARQIQKILDATSLPGLRFDTVSVIVSETRGFIITARELGFWRDKSIYEGQEKLTVEEAAAFLNNDKTEPPTSS